MKHLLTALLAIVFFAVNAEAAPSYSSTVSQARNLRKSEVKLAKAIAKLSAADREKLKNKLAALGADSDADGASDIFEHARGSNVCSADSDSDGIPDGEDGYENDDNKQGDVEGKGTVTSFTDPSLVVGGKTFTVTDTTKFEHGLSSKADLVAGTCVKIEAYVDASNVNIAKKIGGSSRCSGSNGGGGGHDD